ncbi:MAG: TatD family hydrolase [archaeon]|nr:TatD family hydrolase [archaeon]
MLVDSHCHLDWFKNPAEIMENAKKKNVELVLSNATGKKSIEANLLLAEKFPNVKIALGIHPVDLLKMSETDQKEAFELIKNNLSKATAIGEIGLDHKYADETQKEFQEHLFRHFVDLAISNNLPCVVHARYAETQCLDILEGMQAKKVLMHWFTNSKKTSTRAVSLGYYLSCGPIILNDLPSAEIVKETPLENLLLETDAPVSFNGEQSEPSWIPKVCEKVAELKGVDFEVVSEVTGRNFNALFGNNI